MDDLVNRCAVKVVSKIEGHADINIPKLTPVLLKGTPFYIHVTGVISSAQ